MNLNKKYNLGLIGMGILCINLLGVNYSSAEADDTRMSSLEKRVSILEAQMATFLESGNKETSSAVRQAEPVEKIGHSEQQIANWLCHAYCRYRTGIESASESAVSAIGTTSSEAFLKLREKCKERFGHAFMRLVQEDYIDAVLGEDPFIPAYEARDCKIISASSPSPRQKVRPLKPWEDF